MSSKRRHNLTSKKRAGGGPGQFTLSRPDVLTKGQRARIVREKSEGKQQDETGGGNGAAWVLIALWAAVILWAIFWQSPAK